MATSSNTGARKAATTRKTNTTRRSTASSRRSTASTRRSTSSAHRAAGNRRRSATNSSTQPKTPIGQAQQIAERAVLVPVGATLLAQDNLVSTVNGLATRYRTRAGLGRELKRYERRGATARNRFERRARRSRTRFERELRQRRNRVERTVRQNRRRFEREVRSVRKDLVRQSGQLSSRMEKLVTDAQVRLNGAR